jgi:DNA polymerase-3 subunit epsilon
MRQIALDTETTGVDCDAGERVIEVACIELIDGELTGATFHHYINPQRPVSEGAVEVHGITNAFLEDKQRFVEIAADFLAFIDGAELIIHHAPFDLGFLNMELRLAMPDEKSIEDRCRIIDTLTLAKAKFPSQKNNLSALAERLGLNLPASSGISTIDDAMLTARIYQCLSNDNMTPTKEIKE